MQHTSLFYSPRQRFERAPVLSRFSGQGQGSARKFGLTLAGLLGLSTLCGSLALPRDEFKPGGSSVPKSGTVSSDFPDVKPEQLREMRLDSLTGDLRVKETEWAKKVGPYVLNRLVSFYQADNEGKSKVHYGTFVAPGERGADRGLGPSLHILKYHDETLKDGTQVRTYVNEYWPMDEESGALMLPDLVRVRIVSLRKGEKEPEVITDQLNMIWAENVDGSLPDSPLPVFYRQHYFGTEKDPETKKNVTLQVRDRTSAPSSCISCHNPRLGKKDPGASATDFKAKKPDPELDAILAEGLTKNWREAEAMTAEKDFHDKQPVQQHAGYKEYMAYLENRMKNPPKSEYQRYVPITPVFIKQTAEALKEVKRIRIPNMIQGLLPHQKKPTTLEWTDGDVEAYGENHNREFHNRQPAVPYKETVTVTDKKGDKKTYSTLYERAGYSQSFYNQLGLGTWWGANIPAFSHYPESNFPTAEKNQK